jgi:hypothetical protein
MATVRYCAPNAAHSASADRAVHLIHILALSGTPSSLNYQLKCPFNARRALVNMNVLSIYRIFWTGRIVSHRYAAM